MKQYWITLLLAVLLLTYLVSQCLPIQSPCDSSWREETRELFRQYNPSVDHCDNKTLKNKQVFHLH